MIEIDLFPDELLSGHIGRLALWNTARQRVDFEFDLRRSLAARGHRLAAGTGFVPLVAFLAAKPIDEIILKHTLWPAQRATDHEEGLAYFECMFTTGSWRGVAYRLRAAHWLCTECITCDVATHKHSYWHRGHQLPGQMRCERHKIPLRHVHVERKPFLFEQPHEALERSKETDGILRECASENRYVQRAMTIHSSIVNGVFQAPRSSFRPAFLMQSELIGMGADSRGKFSRLESLVQERFPSEWIAHAMQGNKAPGPATFAFIEDALNSGGRVLSPIAVAVIAAALFECVEDVIRAMSGAPHGST